MPDSDLITNTCIVLGVKEAFLKLAQSVISLHQHNQLGEALMEPSYSPLNSYTINPQPNPTPNSAHNGVHHEPVSLSTDHEDSRCCSSS